jgi:hypothetical protein
VFDSNLRPNVPIGTHPIELAKYTLGTDAVINLYDEVKQWIENRTGGMAYARPRIGKTSAIRYLKFALPNDYGVDLPIFHISCDQGTRFVNENKFYEELLLSIGHGLPFSGNVPRKSDRLIKYFVERAESSGTHRIILFLDEAQCLEELQYKILMDIYNKLDLVGINLTVILVGQEELEQQRSALLYGKKAQIVGRFMVHSYKIFGVKTLDELEIVLEGYDSVTEFPAESGWSYTRFFFPNAFEDGFRLKNYASVILGIIIELRLEAGLRKALEIPMQYLTLTIEYVLKKFGINGKNNNDITRVQWIEAIRKSGYIDNDMYMDML